VLATGLGLQAYRRKVLSMVYSSTVLAQGRFRRQISTESYYRVGSQAYQLQQLLGL